MPIKWRPFCSAEQNHFGRGSFKEHFYESVLKSGHWPRKSCRLKVGLFLALMDMWLCDIVLAILVDNHPRNISVKILAIRPLA